MSGFHQEAVLGCSQADLEHVRAIVSQAGTSFARGMKILPAERRYGMFAVYAFCREVDDIADGDVDVPDRAAALEAWHARVERLYRGEARGALDRVLVAALTRFRLRKEDFAAVIDGMAMDAGTPVVAPDESTLDLYCDRVASAVGRLSVRVFGDSSPDADRVAHHLGRALQLTNILRDVQEDADRGRLYLPRELLTRYNVPLVPADALYARGLDPLCRILAARAKDHFREARSAMRSCDPVAMRPARMMAASYGPVLSKLLARGWVHPDRPVHVNKALRLIRALVAYVR
ncbi:presqualene diphosphate synthase HpnD [Swaminathania salitolerans]|uniref:Squalene synthase HpnD n=1 Tax=Swaminathania salitolerans TaxID=182838 RepID=A0A511BSJ2_9PROT|nr:presqualene diphosphate synthase HpnD [Swaminathania salitolerans]GBQ13376.1 phytoene synthase [Swaminathania salitolerans LMG 21291]GEL03299.1 squalene synthase HpnD [Swaminathania salitolerans]